MTTRRAVARDAGEMSRIYKCLQLATDIEKWLDGRHPAVVEYVERASRRKGAGRLAMLALIDEAAKAGLWKLVSVWKDIVIGERLIVDNL